MIDAAPVSESVRPGSLVSGSFSPPREAGRARAATPVTLAPADEARLRAAIDAHFDAMWRFLRRMGVDDSAAPDAAQQVLVVFARKLPAIAIGAERSFLFGTALRVAADARKVAGRSRALFDASDGSSPSSDGPAALADANAPGADQQIDDRRARRMLDEILRAMPEEMRAVFVMCEIEELTMAEAAQLLEVPAGTVASRLRRARELFAQGAAEMRARFGGTNEHTEAEVTP